MNAPDCISRATQIIKRKDGSEVKIVATEYGMPFTSSVGVDVFRRSNPNEQWTLCNDRPHPDWRSMSVDEYNRRGRAEKLQFARHGEIFKVAALIGKTREEAAAMGAQCIDSPEQDGVTLTQAAQDELMDGSHEPTQANEQSASEVESRRYRAMRPG